MGQNHKSGRLGDCLCIPEFNPGKMAGNHVGHFMGECLGGLVAIDMASDAHVPIERLVVAIGWFSILATGGDAVQLEVVQKVGVESHARIGCTINDFGSCRFG